MCGWAPMKASVRLILAVCCVYTVLSGFPRGEGLSDELSLCAVALNHSVNTSNTSDYFSLSKSVCRGDDYYTGCMDYQGTVFIESDSVSHTGASSVIRVAINPNATAGQEEFYYTFCVSYNESLTYELVACASNEGEELQIQHTWEKNGLAQVRVGVFPNYYHGEPWAAMPPAPSWQNDEPGGVQLLLGAVYLCYPNPCANLSVRFNNNNSIVADTKVYLHICANGSAPHPPITSPPVTHLAGVPCPSYEMSFSEKGRYDMIVTFSNKVSCSRCGIHLPCGGCCEASDSGDDDQCGSGAGHSSGCGGGTCHSGCWRIPPLQALPEPHDRNGRLKFIDLSERNVSAWSRFKQKIRGWFTPRGTLIR
ncbi:hypothetical protein GBAR_LOCUS14708 [Geodia barretti]|uniref:Uncharacterized protein n=1 Tax=Geodia barretti TaxID=519541 RepID=A0AA35WT12_GEOBA|nr:hypothetical protein GBAR_LOCUS14708 [Geodia barretti]